MLSCRICNGTCDPGDLRDGVCDDCRYEQQREKTMDQELKQLVNAEFRQIRLEDVLNESSY